MDGRGVSQEMLGRIFDELETAIFVFSADRQIIYANKASGFSEKKGPVGAAEAGHFDANEYYSEDGTKLNYPRGSIIDDALAGKETHDLVLEHRDLKKRTEQWISISCVPVFAGDGTFSYGIIWYRDISLRKKREHKLRFLLESAKILSITTEFEQRLKEKARLAVPTLADWCAINTVGKSGRPKRVALVHRDPKKIAIVEEFEHRRMSSGGADSGALARVLRSGEAEFYPIITPQMIEDAKEISPQERADIMKLGLSSMMVIPIKAGGSTLGALTFAYAESGRTYTPDDFQFMQEFAAHVGVLLENSRLYEEIRERDRSKDTFLALLSHELRNPLAPITTALEHLRLTNTDPSVDAELSMIRHQFDHIARLLNDMLDVTRFTRGKIALEFAPVNLVDLIDRVVTSARAQLEASGVDLHVIHPQHVPPVSLDATRVEQALQNLLSNAIKFSKAGGAISVELSVDANEARIAVRDTGRGILPEELEKIFEPYYQSARTSQGSGLGVGLMLVQEIARLHDGRIEAVSAGADSGSTFTLILPNKERSNTKADTPSELPRWEEGSARNILVVDDNAAAADALVKLLRALGWNAHGAYSAKEALSRLKEHAIDLMFLDIGMPEMNGYELVSILRADGVQLPIIALSGYGMEEDKRKARAAGFTDHLTKPISAQDLRKALTGYFEGGTYAG